MESSISFQGSVGLITLTGKMDTTAATLFDAWFAEQDMQECSYYIMNMAAVQYITSAGLRSIVKLCKLMESRHGKLVVCCATPPVRDLFKISGFTAFLTCCNSLEEALSLQSNPGV